MHPRTVLTCALALAAAAAAVGCDKKAAPPPAATAGSAAAPPAAPAGPDDSACKLVSKDDASKLLGHPVADGVVGTKPGKAAQCRFMADAPAGSSVSVLLYPDGDDGMRTTLAAELLGKDPPQIPNVGMRAFRNADGTRFGVFAKGKFVFVTATSADNTGPSPANAEALAAALANRM